MQLSFLGVAQTVTGSKFLVEELKRKYLIDCGIFQGEKALRLLNREPFPVDPKTIEAVILTHAHLDHSGYLPLLVKNGFRGTIFSSYATAELCEILLLDAGRIQEEDARRANRYGYSKHHPALPLYTEDDAKKALKRFQRIRFDKPHSLTKDLTFTLSHSGHILGSAFITLKNQSSTLVFSGDLGRRQDPIMNKPARIRFADYLVLESTYGAKRHSGADVLDLLDEILNSTFSKGGKVVIPAFAVGRSQALLYYLYRLRQQNRLSARIPIFLDSPMAQNATRLWCDHHDDHLLTEAECADVCEIARYVQSQEESKRINKLEGPAIILSASGMAEGGRVLHHIAHCAPHPENTILFAGFQASGTRGDRMLRGEREVKIHGEMVPVRARVENLDMLSSHADYEEILQWLKGFDKPPKEIFLTHGELQAAESLKSKIEAAFGWKVTIPHYLDSYTLD